MIESKIYIVHLKILINRNYRILEIYGYQDMDRSKFRIGQFLEEGMLSSNSLFFLRSHLHTRNRIEDGIRTIERLLIRFGFYPGTPFQTSRTIIRRFYPNVISDQNESLSRFSVFIYPISFCHRCMFEVYQFWYRKEKKLDVIKLLLNDKNKFFDSRILYESNFRDSNITLNFFFFVRRI